MTTPERMLLRRIPIEVGMCIAAPGYGVDQLRLSHHASGGHGFNLECGPSSMIGRWHEWLEDAWRENGKPYRWRHGRLLREVRISYPRLQKWAESLPADVREQALHWWQTSPEYTRDLDKLQELALAQLADPEPVQEAPDLLSLLAEDGAPCP